MPKTKPTTSESEIPLPPKNNNYAYVLIIIGLYFLLRNLGILRSDLFQLIFQFWPIVLVYYGLKILNR